MLYDLKGFQTAFFSKFGASVAVFIYEFMNIWKAIELSKTIKSISDQQVNNVRFYLTY